jgi:hypothetical protein
MGETCCTYGEEKRCMRDFGGETWGKDLDVDGRITLEWIVKKSVGGGDEINVFQEGDRQRAGSIKCGKYLAYLMICWLLKKDLAPWG